MALGFIKKITDFIMPLEPIEEDDYEEEKVESKKEPAKSEQIKRVETPPSVQQPPMQPLQESVNTPMMDMSDIGQMRTAEGGSVAFGGMKYTAYARKEEPVKMKPQLTVVKGSGISVKINKPSNFEEGIKFIADDLLNKNVVIVNYELVDSSEQRRINDFVNGVCYATDGRAEQISEQIVLYMPEGIDTEAALMKYGMR